MTAFLVGTVFPWLLIAVGSWLGYQLVLQNGRILLRLEAIEKHLVPRAGTNPSKPGGLSRGMAAPDFELPDLAGVRHKLSGFRGMDLLLVFFNPQCGFCSKMAGDLAALPIDGANGRDVPVVVTTGDADENRKFIERHGIRCVVLLQEQMEVAHQFRAQDTPMGYRIDSAGRIASELTVGAEPLLELANGTKSHHHESGGNGKVAASHGKQVDPSLAHSRLNRNGLKAGTMAPDFRLPRIDEGELSRLQQWPLRISLRKRGRPLRWNVHATRFGPESLRSLRQRLRRPPRGRRSPIRARRSASAPTSSRKKPVSQPAGTAIRTPGFCVGRRAGETA
jgi:peroxiredoxin